MKTIELLEIIGEPTGSIIIKHRFGNATLHSKGFWSCDPCYLPDDLEKRINDAHAAKYPWLGRDYIQHNQHWMPFEVDGQTLYARSCSDGDGYFGNCVDAGWVVIFPFDMAPVFMREAMNILERT